MKHKFMLIIAAAFVWTLGIFSTTAFAASYTGHLDGVSGDTISGWAWDSENPQADVDVTVVIKNSADGSVIREVSEDADDYYSHLESQGIGTGSYGFSVNAALSSLPDGSYLAEAYANGSKLPNSLLLEKSQGTVTASSAASLRSLGVFYTTAYCPCYSCSEGWGRHTSTGAIATAGHTIAVDPRVIPYGSRVMINGTVYTAEDRGGGVKGNHIDIFFDTHGETRQYGTRNVEVFLLQ